MNYLRARLGIRDRDDEVGMTIVEVLVAITILGVLAAASLGVFLTGTAASLTQQRRQIAVTLASAALESARALPAERDSATGVSSLLAGRYQNATQSSWASNTSVPGVAQTYVRWDATATAASVPTLAISTTQTQSGTEFTVDALLGTCYLPQKGGACTTLTGHSSPPATAPAGYTEMLRVIVVVRWDAGKSCADGSCVYSAVTLVDVNSDLDWNTHE